MNKKDNNGVGEEASKKSKSGVSVVLSLEFEVSDMRLKEQSAPIDI